MKVFAIGDLHLSGKNPKPMEIFGDNWTDHFQKITSHWQECVGDEDLVLLCGDTSWAMHLEDALPDLTQICSLPGHKVLLRGNHDYWWSSLNKIRPVLFNNTYVLQNDCLVFGDVAIIGSRGWNIPGDKSTGEDQKIYLREAGRLTLSATKRELAGKTVFGMMHFPPFDNKNPSAFTQIFSEAGAKHVVYGHLHGEAHKTIAPEIVKDGVVYHLVSCDYLEFRLKQIQ